MSFKAKYEKYLSLVSEQDEQPQDATAPAPEQAPAVETPTGETQVNVPPEGYVDVVRLLAKALTMNIPAGELDSIYSGEGITKENTFDMLNKLKGVMKENEVDNSERLSNPNYLKFAESITARNFAEKLDYIKSVMKIRDPYIENV